MTGARLAGGVWGTITDHSCAAPFAALFSEARGACPVFSATGVLGLRLRIWVWDEQSRLLLARGVAGTSQDEVSVVLSSSGVLSWSQDSQGVPLLCPGPRFSDSTSSPCRSPVPLLGGLWECSRSASTSITGNSSEDLGLIPDSSLSPGGSEAGLILACSGSGSSSESDKRIISSPLLLEGGLWDWQLEPSGSVWVRSMDADAAGVAGAAGAPAVLGSSLGLQASPLRRPGSVSAMRTLQDLFCLEHARGDGERGEAASDSLLCARPDSGPVC